MQIGIVDGNHVCYVELDYVNASNVVDDRNFKIKQ